MAKDTLTYEDLRSALKRKELAPVFLLYGDEDYLVSEAEELIINAALRDDERGFNLDVVYGNEGDARTIVAHAASFPMMAERRVVVLREMDKLQNRELLASYIEQPSATTCLVLISSKPDFRKKPYSSAKRFGTAVEFKPLNENTIPGWIVDRAQKAGRKFDPEAARLLASYVGNSLREVESEMQKLFVYAGEKEAISIHDVAEVVGVSKEYNIFELQKAVGGKDVLRSSLILERMLDAGENGTMILSMLTRYFVALWKLHDMRRRGVAQNTQASEAGVHPFYLKEYLAALEQFSSRDVEDAFCIFAFADEQLKSTGIDHKTVMLTALIQVVDRGLHSSHVRKTG